MSTKISSRHSIATRLATPRFPAHLAARLSAGALALGLVGSGCGEVMYGPAAEPTALQQVAIAALGSVALRTVAASQGKADAASLLTVQSSIAMQPDYALADPLRGPPAGSTPVVRDASCTSGTAASGFRYSGCPIDGGTLEGVVTISASVVRYELRVLTTWDQMTARLEGELAVIGGRLSGTLEYSKGREEQSYDAATGSTSTLSVGGPKTFVVWDVGTDSRSACISQGTVRVQVQGYGGERNTLFSFSGCDRVTAASSL